MSRHPYTVTGILLLVLSFLVIWGSRAYEYWAGNAPGPGFLPLWLGILLAVLSGALIWDSTKKGNGSNFGWPGKAGLRNLVIVVGSLFGMLLAMPYLGFRITAVLFLYSLFSAFPRYGRWWNLLLAVVISLGFYELFEAWLMVPLPVGMLGV